MKRTLSFTLDQDRKVEMDGPWPVYRDEPGATVIVEAIMKPFTDYETAKFAAVMADYMAYRAAKGLT